jgi:hypothetical protein
MIVKTKSAAREMTATRASSRDTAPAGTVERLTRADSVAQGKDARASLRPTRPRRQSKPARRQTVQYGIALYALTRLPFDRRFQREVITLAIGLAAAKGIMHEGVQRTFNDRSVWPERNDLRETRHQQPAAE